MAVSVMRRIVKVAAISAPSLPDHPPPARPGCIRCPTVVRCPTALAIVFSCRTLADEGSDGDITSAQEIELAIDSGRRQNPPVPAMHRYCECCDMQVVENAYHFVFDCPLNAIRRLEMTDMIDRLTANNDYFGWRRMSWNQRFSFLLGDGPTPSVAGYANNRPSA